MDDKELVQNILNGDRRALTQLIGKYQRLVMHMVCRLIDNEEDREEIAQDVFVKVFQKLRDFNFESKLSTWIATIAYRHSVNHLKKVKKQFLTEELDLLTNYPVAEERFVLDQKDQAAYIRYWIQKLPVNYRMVLTLYHLEGLAYSEIMEIMDMPEGTVKNYLFRARQKLKELMAPVMGKEVFLYG
ncbi:MAG: sigma-70 family RNA polymerase sigma factor [Cyclobacteriaceae bacterium]|nr:sigma-70 family RNA polymerase sigma factor [Cyclobacteriaceae bacterium]